MNNEKYQENIEQYYKARFQNKAHKYFYQGDLVSEILYNRTRRYIKGRILDIGAGTGAFIKLLKTKGYCDARGIDLCPKSDFVEKGSITNLEFEASVFNTILCTEVLEHLDAAQLEKGLKEMYRVLARGGCLIITVPYEELLEKDSAMCPACGHKFHIVGHVQSFDKKRISGILMRNEFSAVHMEVLPLPIMSKLPFSGFYWRLLMLFDKRIDFYKTLIVVAKRHRT